MKPPLDPIPRGSETILLVDPDPAPRKLAGFMLGKQGYRVLEARSAAEAVILVRETGDPIDLAIVELHLPRVNGRELARQLQELRPAIRVLFMSDPEYATFLRRLAVPASLEFLRKPFTMRSLADHVRRVLDRPVTATAPGCG
jgi:DNA-binding response OmpR family regulator